MEPNKPTEQITTSTRWYQRCCQRLAAFPREPYIAFLVAAVIATVVSLSLTQSESIFALILFFPLCLPLWLPVVAGDVALLYWCRDQTVFKPSLMMRILILTLITEGLYYINHYANPPTTRNHETMNQLWLMSL